MPKEYRLTFTLAEEQQKAIREIPDSLEPFRAFKEGEKYYISFDGDYSLTKAKELCKKADIPFV